MTKIKKLKLYGKKNEFRGFIAEIYIKNGKVIIKSKDKAVKEILENEINKAIEDRGGLFVPFAETVRNVLINDTKIQFYEVDRKMEVKVIEDKNGKANDILKTIDEIQKKYQDKLNVIIKKRPSLYGFYRSRLVEEIIKQLETDNHYKVKHIGGQHSDCYKFVKINDPNFIDEVIKGICFSQWSDNSGNYHPALFTKLRDIGYKIIREKSLIVEE